MKLFRRNIGFFIVSIAVLVFSCNTFGDKNNGTERIPREKFVSVLVDIHLIDGVFSISKIRRMYNNRKEYRDVIFKKHNITSKQFNNTILYYSKNTKEFQKIYASVERKLMELETQVEAERKKE